MSIKNLRTTSAIALLAFFACNHIALSCDTDDKASSKQSKRNTNHRHRTALMQESQKNAVSFTTAISKDSSVQNAEWIYRGEEDESESSETHESSVKKSKDRSNNITNETSANNKESENTSESKKTSNATTGGTHHEKDEHIIGGNVEFLSLFTGGANYSNAHSTDRKDADASNSKDKSNSKSYTKKNSSMQSNTHHQTDTEEESGTSVSHKRHKSKRKGPQTSVSVVKQGHKN